MYPFAKTQSIVGMVTRDQSVRRVDRPVSRSTTKLKTHSGNWLGVQFDGPRRWYELSVARSGQPRSVAPVEHDAMLGGALQYATTKSRFNLSAEDTISCISACDGT